MKHLLTALLMSAALPAWAADKLSVALDWTPNTNHVGLYVAQAKGWYDEAGLEVDILPYTDTSSGVLVSSGVAQFGILSDIGFNVQRAAGADLKLVLAVVQHETGRLVFNGKREDIQRPADLDGMTYAGFGSAWETALISTMIKNDGGKGEFETVTLGTSAYEALASGAVDFTLEITTWEGVNAKILDRPQRAFVYSDYGVPDQQTTVLGANESWLDANPDQARAFVSATQRGYAFAVEHPTEAADILIEASDGMLPDARLVHGSMQALVDEDYLQQDGEPVGLVDGEMLANLSQFLFDAGALHDAGGTPLTEAPDVSDWFTNEYLTQ